jgi:hypothetical protein
LSHGRVGLLQVLLATNGDEVTFGVLVKELKILWESSAESLEGLLVQSLVV